MNERNFYSLARGMLGFASAVIAAEALHIAWFLAFVGTRADKIFADILGPGALLPALTRFFLDHGFQLGMGVLFLVFCVLFWMWKNHVKKPGGVFWVAAAAYIVLLSIKEVVSFSQNLPLFEIIRNLTSP